MSGPWILDTQMTGTYAARVSHAKSLMEGVACQDVGEAELLVVVQGVRLQVLVCVLIVPCRAHQGRVFSTAS